MKRFILPLLLLAMPAFAAEPVKPPAPTCGKTVEECQKVVDGLTNDKADLQMAYGIVRQQRDAAQQQLNDTPVNTAIQQQQTARQPKAPPAK